MTEQEYIERRFSVYAACYCYSANYHGGQWSRSYRLGCIVEAKGFEPGLTFGLDERTTREQDPAAADLLDRLLARDY